MHTQSTQKMFTFGLRIISVLMILSMLLANIGVQPASASTYHTISGNAGVASATVTYNGSGWFDADGSTTADGSGNYTITILHGWDGTVTPSKAGYTFSPTSRSYSNISVNQANQNYSATAVMYTISGTVGTTGAGATITYTGGSTTANSTTGNYSFTVSHGWSGTVTPSKDGYVFTPVIRNYTNVTSNQTNQNYTAVASLPSISGNAGVGGATLSYIDGTPKTVTANSSGVYTFQVSNNWSGTVTPSKTGFSFVPGNRAYTNVVSGQVDQNYTARPTAFTFASMGDGQAEAAYFTTTVNQIKTLNPALVLYNGDLEDAGFVTTQINPMINVLKTANLFNNTFLVRGNADDQVSGSAALWESYFETAPNIKVLPPYVINKAALNSSSDHLNYSFDYGNSIFIGLDVPGDIDNLNSTQLDFLNARLTYAEGQGLTHAFIFFHGPEYPVTSVHSLCSGRADASCTPPSLMTIINNHPIVTATFHGHEHVLGWTHMDNTRIDGLTRSYEQFITSPSGSATYNEYVYPDRIDYVYPDMDNSQGFATISVDGISFTYNIYKVGTTQPVWSHTFSKINTAPTISDITDQSTDEDTATSPLPFTVSDVETTAAYLTVTAASSNTTLVPSGNISLGGSGTNRTLSVLPAANQSGTAIITVSVMDGSSVISSDTFQLTVTPVNDAPIADAQSVSLSWNTSIDLTLSGTDVENSPLTYSIVDAPAHGSLSGSGANQTYAPATNYSGADSFTFKVNDGTVDSVSATVSINVTAHTISGNAGVAGAILTYTNGTPKTVTADGAGLYSFQVPTDWSGTVTPAKDGYIFSPTSMTYVNVLADQSAQNYTTTGVTFTISGNTGLAGATLSYTDGTPKTVTTDEAGMYSFEVPYNWSGMVTPSLSGYGFRPATRTYTNLTSNQFAQDYTTTTARVYYVDKTNPACTDVGQVGSFVLPFCTITRGAYLATAGQIVHVIHGTYAETVFPERSGTDGNPITYWADPGVVVTGRPETDTTAYSAFSLGARNYIVIDGFTVTNTTSKGIYVDASNHVTITNNHVSYAGAPSLIHPYEQGIYMRNTTYSTISGNTTDHNTCIGIRVVGGNNNLISNNTSYSNYSVVETDAAGIELTGSSYNTVINNLTYSNEDTGINVYLWDTTVDVQSTYNLVINNLSYENGDHGIDVNNSPYNTFIGNTVHGNGTTGINIEGEASTGSHHSTVINNISAGNGFTPPSGSFAGNLRVDSASINGTILDYNLINRESAAYQLIWNNISYPTLAAFQAAVPTQEVHGLEGDPLFVDPVPSVRRSTGVPYEGAGIFGNYYPEPGSPAIDSANSSAPSQQETDIDGNSRVDDPATPDDGTGVRTFDDRGAYEFLPLGQSIPVVTTQAVTSITTTTATGNGTITATGEPNPTEHGVVWNTTGDPTITDSKTTDGAVSATGPFTTSMTGLTPGTVYYVRAYATNTMETVYGEEVTFTTLIVPTVTTSTVTNITTTTATGNGNITALGVPNPTQHGFVWGTLENPTISDDKTSDGAVSATGVFTSNITGLTPGTLYHVRAYATNAAGTAYGEDITFTAYHEPSVTTSAITNITTTTATGNGNVTALGVPNPSQHGVVWSVNANPTIADSKTTGGEITAPGVFTSLMTGLTPGTLYYVRAYATNPAGTVYGEEFTFTTLLAPTVITQSVDGITTTTAAGHGNITVLGTFNPTEHGFVWSTTANPTTADFKTTDGSVSATGTFTSSITGLTPGTLYHVRAYATNAAGTSYGEDLTFTALIAPTVTTQAVTSIGTTNAIGNGNITALGVPNPTQHGVVWSTSADPTIADSKTTDGDILVTGPYTSSITGLTPGMLYHVRAYATNTVDTVYGEDVTFTTLPSTTGTTTPATNAGTGTNTTVVGSADWANPGFIIADDTSYASATLTGSILSSGYLEGTDYGFAIPIDAAINGIVVTIGRHESGTRPDYLDVRDSTVKLMKAGVLTGNNKAAAGTEWPTTAATAALYGTSADLWGTTWTPADINDHNFGVALSVISGVNRIAYVDYMRISVTYTVTMVGSNTTVNCGAGAPIVTYGSEITCVATVVRGSGDKTPTGNVSWTTSGSGNFVTSPCVLSGSNGTSTCSVTYTPSSVGSGSHSITATYAGDPNFFTSNGNQIVIVNKATATIALENLAQTYDGTPKSVTAITYPTGLSVDFTYDGLSAAPTNAGSYAVVGTLNDGNYAGSTSGTLVIAKAPALVAFDNLTQTYDGSPKSVTALTTPTGLAVDITYDGSATAPANAGLYAVAGTINDTNYEGTANGTLFIAKAAASVTLGTLTQTYDGSPKPVTASTDPTGLTVEFTYDGSAIIPINAGAYDVVGTINNANYTGSASDILIIEKATATVSLENLMQTYDGSLKSVTAVTTPLGLMVDLAYDGSIVAPINAGTYAVVGTINDTNYIGNASGTLVIEKATASVTLDGLAQIYDSLPKLATAVTDPIGLTVDFTYDGLTTVPTNAGSYAVIGTINDANYTGSASDTLIIAKAAATVTFDNLVQTYDGLPKAATATTGPVGLTVELTYNGSATVPTNAGLYAVVGTINDTNYTGSASGTFYIAKASATVTLESLAQTYDAAPKLVTAITDPVGLTVDITYDGSVTAPSNAGTYDVVGTVNDLNYTGSASDILVIEKATAMVTLGSLTQTYDGTPKAVTAITDPLNLTVDFTYNGSSIAPTDVGSYDVVGTINDANYTGSASDTLVIEKATTTVTLGSLTQTYDGTPKSATAVTEPLGLTVGFTYDGSSIAPTDVGSYDVVGTINDANYTGSASDTLVIEKATATITLGSLTQTYDGTPKSATAVTDPIGLTVAFTYDGSAIAPINAGSYAVVGTINDPNYNPTSDTNTFIIEKAEATVTLGSLNQVYDGTPKSVTVSTLPDGLTVEVTYEGLSTPPSETGSYEVIATVVDTNYSGTASGTLVIAQDVSTHSISLVSGWNLISFRVHPNSTDIATVLASVAGNYDLVYAWDATGGHSTSGNWMMYDPNVPFGNTLESLDETMGFWIHMTTADILEVTGSIPVTTDIHLYTNAGGWNLVAYPSGTNGSLPDVLSNNGIGTDFSLVYAYSANDADPWKLFDQTAPEWANDLTEMVPGLGYWVKVSVNHTWSVEYLAE